MVANANESSPEVAVLTHAVERFSRIPLRPSGALLAADMLEVSRCLDLIQIKFSEMAAAFAETDQYDAEGYLSPIQWIRHNCHLTSGAAAGRVAVGRQIAKLPESTEAMAGGEIGFAHLSLIAQEATALEESGSDTQFNETLLLKKARDFTVGRFRNFCHHHRHANDPAGYAADQAESAQSRTLSLSTGEGGMLWIRGVLDPEGGAVLRTALEPLAKRNGKGDDRKLDHRLADGLVEMANHAMDKGTLPQRSNQRPHLQVTATFETLKQYVGSPAANLEFSLPISSVSAVRLACDCNLTRILLNSDSQVIDVGRSKRVISPSQKRALNVRDKGCRWPGCDRPATYTSGHHLVHWIKGGSTDLPNLVLLCHRHHWLVHEGKWQIVRTDDGQFHVIPPQLEIFQNLARGPGQQAA
jgi:hypothetical protein